MRDDVVMKLLREVKAGKVSVEDARDALSDVELSEEHTRMQLTMVYSMNQNQGQ